MPILPTYDSNKNVSPQLPAVIRNEAAVPFQNQQKVLGAVGDVFSAWGKVQDTMQANQRRDNWAKVKAQIEAESAADPAIQLNKDGLPEYVDNSGKYFARLHEAKAKILDGMSNKYLANQLRVEFDLEAEISGIGIASDFRKKQLAINKEATEDVTLDFTSQMLDTYGELEGLRDMTNPKYMMMDDKVRQGKISLLESRLGNLRDRRDLFLREQVLAGLLSVKDAKTVVEKATLTFLDYRIANETATQEADSDLLTALKDPSNKQFSDIPPDLRIKEAQKLQFRIWRNNTMVKKEVIRQQVTDRIGFLEGVAAGKIDIGDPNVIFSMAVTDPEFANLLQQRKRYGGGVFRTKDSDFLGSTEFSNLVGELYQQRDMASVNKFITRMVNISGDNPKDLNRLGILTDVLATQVAALNPSPENAEKRSVFQKVKDTYGFFKATMSPQTFPFVIEAFYDSMKNNAPTGEKITDARNQALKQTINQLYPDTQVLPDVPNKILYPGEPMDSIFNGPNFLEGDDNGYNKPADFEWE